MSEEVLRVLSNETNQAILNLLAVEPTYPRKIGELLALSEAEVARRLKHMEGLGLVAGGWTHIGKNVKLYRLTTESVSVHFTKEGLRLLLQRGDGARPETRLLTPYAVTVPSVGEFVGREKELRALDGREAVMIVEGMVGIGKTSLQASFAQRQQGRRSVFWHSFRGVESLNWLANRLSLFLAQHGQRALLEAIERGADVADKRELMLQGMDDERFLIVLDDAHRIEDPAVQSWVADATARVRRGKLIVGTRQPLRHHRSSDVRVLHLEGLTDADVAGFLEMKGAAVEKRLLPKIREEVGGHPLALNLLLEAATEANVSLERLLDRVPERDLEEYLLKEVSEGLTDEERQLLTLSSLFRTTFTLEDLSALSPKNLEGALSKLRRRLLVQNFEEHFALHEIIRNFFYQRLQDKARLHLKAAEYYLGQGSVEGRLEAMHHFLVAKRRDRVLDLLEQNLDLREFDFIDAGYQNLYLATLELFDKKEVSDPRRWALIEDEKGDIHFHRAEHEVALRLYESANAHFENARDAARVADLAWKRGLALHRLGRRKEALEICEATLGRGAADGLARERLQQLIAELAPPAVAGATRKATVRRRRK